ncbi:hypothetical protein FS837_012789, partial [Tulasnella sp. UAMH 9824]
MGISSSKPGEPKSPRKPPLRRTNTQPGQPAPPKTVAPPATPRANISTARSSIEEQTLSRQASRVASRSGGLGFDPSVVSFQSKGTGRSNRRLPNKIPAIFRFNSKQPGRAEEQSFRTRTPSPSPSTRPLPETRTNDLERGAPSKAYEMNVQQLKPAAPEALQVDQGAPQTGSIHSEVLDAKATIGRGAEAISFPKDPRKEITGRNQPWSEEGLP